MKDYPFQIVDVFGAEPFAGNPVAVVALEAEPDTALLLRITRWLNLSETTFLLPPADADADYRVRIFTPARELPFAGHPTLGSCHAWLQAGGVPRDDQVCVQECGAGLVRIRRAGAALAFAAPPMIRSGPVEEETLREIADVLRISTTDIVRARWVDNGPGWVAVMLASAEAALAVEPVRWHGARIDVGVVGPYRDGGADSPAYEIRAFFSDPFGGLVEDPVCGSLNASVAQWLIGEGHVQAPYRVAQGARLFRNGRIDVSQDGHGQVWIGGATSSLVSGRVRLPD